MRRIPINSRQGVVDYALVDDDDFEWLSQHRWHLNIHGYATRSYVPAGTISMHREIIGLSKGDGKIVDHINHVRLDNQRHNLRLATRQLNQRNRLANRTSTSRLLGVSWDKTRRRWTASAWDSDRQARINLGRYHSEEEAGIVAATWREQNTPEVKYRW